jgi:hypothetical protein
MIPGVLDIPGFSSTAIIQEGDAKEDILEEDDDEGIIP